MEKKEGLDDWRGQIFFQKKEKKKKENLGNYRFVILTTTSRNIPEEIIGISICKQPQNKVRITHSQHKFGKNESCQSNLLIFGWVS